MELLISCLAHLIKTFLPALGKKEFRPVDSAWKEVKTSTT